MEYVKRVCMLCLQEPDNFIKENFSEILIQHFQFLIIDVKNSQNVCHSCWSKIYDFHTFYLTIQQVHQNINQLLENKTAVQTIKTEVEDDTHLCVQVKTEESHTLENKEKDTGTPHSNLRRNSNKTNQKSFIKSTNKKIGKGSVDEQIREYFRMECDLCKIVFQSFIDVQRHYRDEHDQAGYITCCGKNFLDRRRIMEHIRRHIKPKDIYTCDICKRTSPCKESLKSHMAIHIPNHLKGYQCDDCPKRFITNYKLKHHKNLKHSDEKERNFVCPDCNKRFLLDSMLKLHTKTVHDIQICDICAKQFKNKYSLANHQKEVHLADSSLQTKCELCGTILKNNISLKQHMRYHNDTPRECSICNKVYPNKNALNSHTRYVHKEKDLLCTMCDKSFKTAVQLKNHMPSHTGESTYTCPYCPQIYRSHGNFYNHRKRHHFDEWTKDRKSKRINGVPNRK